MSPRKPMAEDVEAQRIAQILDGAAHVFAEKGFHKATTKDIAKAAGVAEGSIYNYFASKHDLLIGLLQQLGDMSVLEKIQHDEVHDAKAYYAADAQVQLMRFWQSRKIWQAVLPEILADAELRGMFLEGLNQQYLRFVEPYLRRRIEQGELAPVENTALVARIMQTIPLGLLLLVLLGDPLIEAEWDKLPELMANLVYDGLKNDGEKRL